MFTCFPCKCGAGSGKDIQEHTHTRTYTGTHAHTHIHTHAHTLTHTLTHTHSHIQPWTNTCRDTQTHRQTFRDTQSTHGHTQRQATELIVKVNMINFSLIYLLYLFAVNTCNDICRNKIKEVESTDFVQR